MSLEIAHDRPVRHARRFWTVHGATLSAALFTCAALVLVHFFKGEAWIGSDNDDAMRLVQVRDLLAGQGWFDLTQYRLGPEGGTSMHWSRLVDAPIASLILLFSLFFSYPLAEQAAVFLWPLLTSIPVFFAMAAAARRLGGEDAVLPVLLLTGFFVYQFGKFAPGAIDHHNVQLALTATMFAGLLDRRLSPRSFALAGVASAAAIAVGAETLPLVAVACSWVAICWLLYGQQAGKAVAAFCLWFCLVLAAVFFVTIPPARYGAVQCDSYSGGLYMLGTLGAAMLFLISTLFPAQSSSQRMGVLALAGLGVCALAMLVVPQCLTMSIYDLDPLLQRLWLDNVAEAHSVLGALEKPDMIAGFYVVPAIAIAACFTWLVRGMRSPQLVATLFLLACAFVISLVQIRGAIFSIMLACVPMAVLVAGVRKRAMADGAGNMAQLLYAGTVLISLPLVWYAAATGANAMIQPSGDVADSAETQADCNSAEALEPLASKPNGVVAGISNLGSWVLLHTGHRALSAPYHRNQEGMVAALRIGTLEPGAAETVLHDYDVDWLVFCKDDAETGILTDAAPAGLYAGLKAGIVPGYLKIVDGGPDTALQLFRVAK